MNSGKYKTLSRRFFAALIDGLIFIPFIYLETFFATPEMSAPIVIGGLIIYYSCFHIYSIYLHAIYGQTLGKMAVKVKVLDLTETSIGFRQAIFRETPYFAFSLIFFISEISQILTKGITEDFRDTFLDNVALAIFTIWLVAEAVTAFANEKRRSIHDYIARTIVVRTDL